MVKFSVSSSRRFKVKGLSACFLFQKFKKNRAMQKTDRQKLLQAGFTILREYFEEKPRIKYFTEQQSWKTWKEFESKAAMNREIERIRDFEPKMIFE